MKWRKRRGYVIAVACCSVIALLLWSNSTRSTKSFECYDLASNDKFIFSPSTLRWQAIDSNGTVVRTGHGSAGRSYCPDIRRACRTPSGTYHVGHMQGASCKSSRYPVGKGGSPMPYCMYFSKNYAVHGSYHVPNYNASHGCIRVPPQDAKWLYYNFMKPGTTVIVKPY